MDDPGAGRFIRSYAKYIVALLLFIVAAGILLYLTYQTVKQEMINGLNERQMTHAKQAAKGLESFFDDHISILQNYSKNEHIINFDESGKRLMREFLLSHGREISIISREDSQGRILYAEPYNSKVIGQPVTNMDDFLKAKRTNRITVSDVFTNRRGFQSIIIHAPVFKNGHFDGTIALLVSFEYIAKKYIDDIRIGKEGYAWVISRNGIELSCPVPGHVGNSVFNNCREFPDILAMAERMVKGEQGATTYMFDRIRGDAVSKTTKHAVFLPLRLGDTFWSIVIATPEDEVTGAMNQFRNRLLLIAIILIIAIGFIFYILIKTKIIAKEVEQRRKTEDELRKSERQIADIIEFLPDATLAINKEGRIIIWNKAIEEMTGVPATEMIGKGDYAYTIPFYGEARPQLMDLVFDDHDEIAAKYPKIAREGNTLMAEVFCHALYNNKGAWVAAKASPLHDQSGNIIGAIESIHDITERKRTEEEIHRGNMLLNAIIDNIPNTIFLKDAKELRFVLLNRAGEELTGYSRKDLQGKNDYDFVPKEQADFFTENDRAVLRGKDVVDIPEEYLQTRNKGQRTLHTKKIPLINNNGEPEYLLGISEDITNRKQAEEEKKQLEERLNRAEKMESLGTLAGGVAHDLNNVLGIVVGYAEMALDGVDKSSPLKHHLENVMGGGLKAAAIVDDLLTLARRGVSGSEVLNLNKIIADFQKSPELEKLYTYHPSVKIKTEMDNDLLNISGSSVHLNKSLYNLISNAAEAMPQGGHITIKTTNQSLDKYIQGYENIREGDYVVLSVSDTGEGISEANLKRIFEPFYTKKKMGRSGTGLGLAVVWGTVKDHHGYINVESEVGKGTTFTVYFPVTREDIAAKVETVPISSYMGKGESILVVDDVKEQRDLAAGMLASLNYTVTTAESGDEAVAYLKNHQTDILILDMIMDPGMDGLDTYKSIIKINPKQKAIIVSGYSESERVKTARSIGAGAYVRKPYIKEKLGVAVKKELDRK